MSDDWQAVRRSLRGADMITESAMADGLPAPDRVWCDRWKVEIQVVDRAAIEAWAGWRGLEVHPTPTVDRAGVVLRARGAMYDVPLEVYAVVPSEPRLGQIVRGDEVATR